MKPVVTRLYAVLVALTFVGLFAWAGADWYQDQQKAETDGRAALRQAAGLLSDLSVHHEALDPAALNRSLGAVTSDPRWKVLVLSSDQGTLFYRGPRPTVALDQAVPRWEPHVLTEVKVAIPVFRADGDPLVLEGIEEFYGRPEVFALLQACGFTLVVLLVVTTVMVALSAQRAEPDVPEPTVPEPEEFTLAEEPAGPAQAPGTWEDAMAETVGTLPVDDDYWFDDSLTMEDLPPLEVPPEPRRLRDGAELTDRLNEDLRQALEAHEDVALVLISAKAGSAPLPTWTEDVLDAFPGDAFDYEGGAAVILPGRTLEQGLQAAREFLNRLDQHGGGVVAHAGVAARTGRALVASTLLAEAASARRRSLAGSTRVLGLKIDPDRYREQMTASAPASA